MKDIGQNKPVISLVMVYLPDHHLDLRVRPHVDAGRALVHHQQFGVTQHGACQAQ